MAIRSKSGRTFGCSFALLAYAVSSPAFAEEAAPYDFRGARLGMSLQEFEALPALGTMRLTEFSPRGKKLREGLLTRCAADKDKVNAQIGVVECARAGDNPFTPMQYKYVYTSIGYKFAPDASGISRLFSILIITDREYYGEAVAGLRSKWGTGGVENSSVTNGLGQPLPKSTEIWQNDKGNIELESPCGNVTTICLTYSDKGLVSALAERRAGITGGPASRF